jgi:hypothetical protein
VNGVFYYGDTNIYIPQGSYYGARGIYLNASRQVPTAAENRPVNRRKIIWKKTAMAV